MGNAINLVQKNMYKKNTNSLLNVTLSKMCEFHATFKSICENFAIDITEFEQIFGVSEAAFVIWDTDNNGMIDALELFSGIALNSEAKLDDILRFLFDIFDLNELESLSAIDVEYMVYSCISATYKIYNINSEIDSNDMQRFVNNVLKISDNSRVTIMEFLKACHESADIAKLIQIIKGDTNTLIKLQQPQQQNDNKNTTFQTMSPSINKTTTKIN